MDAMEFFIIIMLILSISILSIRVSFGYYYTTVVLIHNLRINLDF